MHLLSFHHLDNELSLLYILIIAVNTLVGLRIHQTITGQLNAGKDGIMYP